MLYDRYHIQIIISTNLVLKWTNKVGRLLKLKTTVESNFAIKTMDSETIFKV